MTRRRRKLCRIPSPETRDLRARVLAAIRQGHHIQWRQSKYGYYVFKIEGVYVSGVVRWLVTNGDIRWKDVIK